VTYFSDHPVYWLWKKTLRAVKPKFHYADFPVTSATSPRQTRDVPFSPNSTTATSPKLPRTGKFRDVAVMEFWLKGTYGFVADATGKSAISLGIVEFGLYAVLPFH